MERTRRSDALSVIASAMDETHDGLAHFTRKLDGLEDIPSFWFGDLPVWVTDAPARRAHWPLRLLAGERVEITAPSGAHCFSIAPAAVRGSVDEHTETALSDAEFTLFADLAAGLSLESSADRAEVAVSTRRKQLQNVFRKVPVASQAELVSFAGVVTQRLATELDTLYGAVDQAWGGYLSYLPEGVRCGVLEEAGAAPVRYLDFGPVTGTPVMVLHPMVFPDLTGDEVALMHKLGCRAIWPVRPNALSTKGIGAGKWEDHCAAVVRDCHAIHGMIADNPVPVIALVSAGGYATRFAKAHPECVARIDYVSTCYSAGRKPSRDAYFGDFLVRGLRQNGRMAMVLVQHLSGAAFKAQRMERTMRKIFNGSQADKLLLDDIFGSSRKTARIQHTVRHSIGSMRLDYLSQLHFAWSEAAELDLPMTFWHGAQDHVHDLGDLSNLSENVAGAPAHVLSDVGHLTEGASLREILGQICATYSK